MQFIIDEIDGNSKITFLNVNDYCGTSFSVLLSKNEVATLVGMLQNKAIVVTKAAPIPSDVQKQIDAAIRKARS